MLVYRTCNYHPKHPKPFHPNIPSHFGRLETQSFQNPATVALPNKKLEVMVTWNPKAIITDSEFPTPKKKSF